MPPLNSSAERDKVQKTRFLFYLCMVLALFCVRAAATVPGIASELVEKYAGLPTVDDNVKYTLAEHPGQSFYGRVAATPGQTVQIIDSELIVDGKEVRERIYALVPKVLSRSIGPLKVPAGYVFIVQGNYRPNAYIGLVPVKQILGKLVVLVRP